MEGLQLISSDIDKLRRGVVNTLGETGEENFFA